MHWRNDIGAHHIPFVKCAVRRHSYRLRLGYHDNGNKSFSYYRRSNSHTCRYYWMRSTSMRGPMKWAGYEMSQSRCVASFSAAISCAMRCDAIIWNLQSICEPKMRCPDCQRKVLEALWNGFNWNGSIFRACSWSASSNRGWATSWLWWMVILAESISCTSFTGESSAMCFIMVVLNMGWIRKILWWMHLFQVSVTFRMNLVRCVSIQCKCVEFILHALCQIHVSPCSAISWRGNSCHRWRRWHYTEIEYVA